MLFTTKPLLLCISLLPLVGLACSGQKQNTPAPKTETEQNAALANPDIAAVIEAPPKHSITIGGHLYGLLGRSKNGRFQDGTPEPPIYRTNVAEAYRDEVQRLNPKASFQLGDITRYGTDKEWKVTAEIWNNSTVPNFFVAGNHDLRNPENFAANGGLRNKVVIIGANKYICLDAKPIFEDEDLAFIKRNLEDYQKYDHVFVLMHFRHVWDKDPDPENYKTPHKGYTGKSNWNRDVVPMLLGKVNYVITGDHHRLKTQRNLVKYENGEICYIHTTFDYRFEGPLVFVELLFDSNKTLKILPRIVPLDVRDDWYEDVWLRGYIPEGM